MYSNIVVDSCLLLLNLMSTEDKQHFRKLRYGMLIAKLFIMYPISLECVYVVITLAGAKINRLDSERTHDTSCNCCVVYFIDMSGYEVVYYCQQVYIFTVP